MDLKGTKLTWLGHATFLIESAGKRTLIDPWVMNNPKTPDEYKKQLPKIDLMLCTHAHGDHMGDAVEFAKKHDPVVVAMPGFCGWLTKKGVQNCSGMNKGGTQRLNDLGLSVTMLDQKQAIPLLAPARERLLEYDVSRAIARIMSTDKPILGVMSSLPVMGQMNPMMMQRGQSQLPWAFIEELKRDFTVRQIEITADKIELNVEKAGKPAWGDELVDRRRRSSRRRSASSTPSPAE